MDAAFGDLRRPYHQLTGAGIAPLPVQRPIPLRIGAAAARGYARAGRLADGWFPMVAPGPALDEARTVDDHLSVLESGAAAAGLR